jgi:hypothetical protein
MLDLVTGFFKPYLLYIKIAAAFALLASVTYVAHEVANHWREQGRVEIRTEWDKQKLLDADAEKLAIENRKKENAATVLLYEKKNTKVVSDYEQKLKDKDTDFNKRIAADKSHGGLLLPKDYCTGFASKATAASAEGNNEVSQYRLPDKIADGLYEIVKEAQSVVIQNAACQQWIKDNGLYMEQK